LLTEVLIAQVLAQKNGKEPVRILSAGCSSGEEPYSLVMALDAIYGQSTEQLFQIDAGDLDQHMLDKAQAGLYSDFSFRGVDDSVRQRYFKAQDRGYQLAPQIRKQVNFYHLNLLAAEYPAALVNYDIIFFRNVSIYFDLDTRQLIQGKFNRLMREQAILLLGITETLGNDFGVFELVEHAGQYFFIKGDVYRPANQHALRMPQAQTDSLYLAQSAARIEDSEQTDAAPMALAASSAPAEAVLRTDLAGIKQLVHGAEQERALRLLENFPAQADEHYAVCLLKAWLLLNKQAFAQADELLEQALAMQPWSSDAMLMKGLVCKWQGHEEAAYQWFRKVIYSHPHCWPAHYYMADIRRNQQRLSSAIKSYQMVLRILSGSALDCKCLTWIPVPLTASDAAFLSQRYGGQLANAEHSTGVDD